MKKSKKEVSGRILSKSKKSLSPVIATVLLIALVLVLAIIIFLWARSFISERIEKFPGQSIEDTCAKVSFDAVYYLDDAGSPKIEMSNTGNVPIYGIGVKGVKSSGNSKMYSYNVSADVGKSAVSPRLDFDTNEVTKVIIYAQVLGTVQGKSINKPYTCLDQGITKNLA